MRSVDPSNRAAKPGDWTEESADADALLLLIARPTLVVLLPWSAGAVGGSTQSMRLAALRAIAERRHGRMLRGLRLQAPGASLPQEPGCLHGRQLLDRVAIEGFHQGPAALARPELIRRSAWQPRFPSAHETPPDAGLTWTGDYPRASERT